ncbi:unnamed protein product [Trichobilharzia regenti]|nr:unnamed protein product [Trichobilharzia regenti]
MDEVSEGYLFGMGNPLLDMLWKADEDTYKSYGLNVDDAILAEDKHMSIYTELMKKPDVKYVAGGSTLNTVKMIQWILRKPLSCSFVGCIGADRMGDRIEAECRELGLETEFQTTKKPLETGKVAVLINGKNRSIVTYLGAACDLTVQHVKQPRVWSLVERARVFYIAVSLTMAKHATTFGKLFCFNLSAPFISKFYTKEVDEMISHAAHNLPNITVYAVAQHIASRPLATRMKRNRLVIITRGKHPVVYVNSLDMKVHEFPVKTVESCQIVDTNGAGDAFAAGFIAEHILSRPIVSSLESAVKAATYIIQRSGFTLDARDSFM